MCMLYVVRQPADVQVMPATCILLRAAARNCGLNMQGNIECCLATSHPVMPSSDPAYLALPLALALALALALEPLMMFACWHEHS